MSSGDTCWKRPIEGELLTLSGCSASGFYVSVRASSCGIRVCAHGPVKITMSAVSVVAVAPLFTVCGTALGFVSGWHHPHCVLFSLRTGKLQLCWAMLESFYSLSVGQRVCFEQCIQNIQNSLGKQWSKADYSGFVLLKIRLQRGSQSTTSSTNSVLL